MTIRLDGKPQASPVVAGIDANGRAVISTRETAFKAVHVRRRPWAGLCVFTSDFFGKWVQVEGPADLVSLPDAMEGLIALYRDVAGEHPNWAEFEEAMYKERRVLLRVDIQRAGPTIFG